MRVKISGVRRIFIREEYIKLDSLLKLASLVGTGGEAKMVIQGGEVMVGGAVCIARGKKIRPGDVVKYGGEVLLVQQR